MVAGGDSLVGGDDSTKSENEDDEERRRRMTAESIRNLQETEEAEAISVPLVMAAYAQAEAIRKEKQLDANPHHTSLFAIVNECLQLYVPMHAFVTASRDESQLPSLHKPHDEKHNPLDSLALHLYRNEPDEGAANEDAAPSFTTLSIKLRGLCDLDQSGASAIVKHQNSCTTLQSTSFLRSYLM